MGPIQIEKTYINKKLKQKYSNLNLWKGVKVLKWSESQMVEAIAAVKEKRMTQRTASKIYKVLQCTLQNRLNGKTQIGACPERAPKLGNEDELKLVDYASKRASTGISFGKCQFMKYAGDMAI